MDILSKEEPCLFFFAMSVPTNQGVLYEHWQLFFFHFLKFIMLTIINQSKFLNTAFLLDEIQIWPDWFVCTNDVWHGQKDDF